MIKVIKKDDNITLTGHCREHDACMNLTGIVNAYRAIYTRYGYSDSIKAAPGYLHIKKIPPALVFNSFLDVLEVFQQAYPGNIIPF